MTHAKSKRIWSVLGIVLVVLIAIGVWWTSRSSEGSDFVSVPPSTEPMREPPVALDDTAALERDIVPPQTEEVIAPAGPVTARIRVLDEQFRIPLRAWIACSGAEQGFTDESGLAALRFEHARVQTLSISAPGYVDLSVKDFVPSATIEREILLAAERKSCVLVEFERGGVAVDVNVTWRAAVDEPEREYVTAWMYSRMQRSGNEIATRTDASGRACLALAGNSLAVVEHPLHHARTTVRVSPGQVVRVVLPERALRLRFVEADTEKPIAGLELDSWCPNESESMSQAHRTDSDGVIALLPTSYPILVRRTRENIWLAELIPSSPSISRVGAGGDVHTQLRIERAPTEDPVVVRVKRCGGNLRLVDDATNQPISGRVHLERRTGANCPPDAAKITGCTLHSPRGGAVGVEGTSLSVTDGLFTLPCTLPGVDSPAKPYEKEREVVIVVSGYAPHTIPLASLPGNSATVPHEIRLTPVRQRTLRVVQSDGRPSRMGIGVYSPKGDIVVYSNNRPSADGVHGLFDWMGSELWVNSGAGNEWPYRFTAEQCAASEELLLAVPVETGSIQVEGIPRGARPAKLIAKSGVSLAGIVYRPTKLDETTCTFESLPVGTYLVGPSAWVLSAEWQSFSVGDKFTHEEHSSRLVVRPNETTKMPWLATWSGGQRIEGRVRIVPKSTVAPFLVPLYGGQGIYGENPSTGIPRMIFGRRSPRLPLEPDGSYHIDASDPLPLVIAVCTPISDALWGTVSNLQVIETLLPGESIDIPVGSIELKWTSAPLDKPRWLTMQWPGTSFRHPLDTMHNNLRFAWDTSSPLRVETLPLGVRELKYGKAILPFELRAGEVTHIDVDAAAIAQPPR